MPTNDPQCPKCGGNMWNNIATKKNPRQPDFKCKDKNCDGVIWPPRDGAKPATQKVDNAPSPYSAGPHIPAIDGPAPEPVSQTERIEKGLQLYTLCWTHAVNLAKKDLGNDATHEGISAQAATMYIQMCQRGLAA